MKNVITSLCLCLSLIGASVYAGDHKMHARGDNAIEKLNLDADRKAAVKEAMKSFHEKQRALREANKAEMKALLEEQKAVLSGILTEEEIATLMSQRGKRHHKGRFCDGHDKE